MFDLSYLFRIRQPVSSGTSLSSNPDERTPDAASSAPTISTPATRPSTSGRRAMRTSHTWVPSPLAQASLFDRHGIMREEYEFEPIRLVPNPPKSTNKGVPLPGALGRTIHTSPKFIDNQSLYARLWRHRNFGNSFASSGPSLLLPSPSLSPPLVLVSQRSSRSPSPPGPAFEILSPSPSPSPPSSPHSQSRDLSHPASPSDPPSPPFVILSPSPSPSPPPSPRSQSRNLSHPASPPGSPSPPFVIPSPPPPSPPRSQSRNLPRPASLPGSPLSRELSLSPSPSPPSSPKPGFLSISDQLSSFSSPSPPSSPGPGFSSSSDPVPEHPALLDIRNFFSPAETYESYRGARSARTPSTSSDVLEGDDVPNKKRQLEDPEERELSWREDEDPPFKKKRRTSRFSEPFPMVPKPPKRPKSPWPQPQRSARNS